MTQTLRSDAASNSLSMAILTVSRSKTVPFWSVPNGIGPNDVKPDVDPIESGAMPIEQTHRDAACYVAQLRAQGIGPTGRCVVIARSMISEAMTGPSINSISRCIAFAFWRHSSSDNIS